MLLMHFHALRQVLLIANRLVLTVRSHDSMLSPSLSLLESLSSLSLLESTFDQPVYVEIRKDIKDTLILLKSNKIMVDITMRRIGAY
jgi:hypothetical protein